jgi:hypothetical protein
MDNALSQTRGLNPPAPGSKAGDGSAAIEAAGLGGSAVGAPSVESVGDASWLTPTFLGVTYDLDPARNYPVLVPWCKAAFAWALTVLWLYWLWHYLGGIMDVLMMTPQIHGNPLVGGTGAQVTSLANAGIFSAIVLTVPAAISAVAYTVSGTTGGIDVLSSTILASAPSGVGVLVTEFVPWRNVWIDIVGPPLVMWGVRPIIMGAQLAIHWIAG